MQIPTIKGHPLDIKDVQYFRLFEGWIIQAITEKADIVNIVDIPNLESYIRRYRLLDEKELIGIETPDELIQQLYNKLVSLKIESIFTLND